MAVTPVLMVGSGTGANLFECSEGSGLPVRLLSSTAAGATAPSRKRQIGMRSAVRP